MHEIAVRCGEVPRPQANLAVHLHLNHHSRQGNGYCWERLLNGAVHPLKERFDVASLEPELVREMLCDRDPIDTRDGFPTRSQEGCQYHPVRCKPIILLTTPSSSRIVSVPGPRFWLVRSLT
jgi:hypothetical protein